MANWNTGPGYYPPPGQGGAPYAMPPPGPYGTQQPPPFGQNPYMGNPYATQPPMQPGYVPQPAYIPPQNLSNQAPMYGGTSYGGDESYKFDDLTIRNGFIRKVYSILMAQLLVSFAFVALSSYHERTRLFIQKSPGLLIVSMVVMIATVIALSCCENLRRKSPHNIILLSLFTLSESFLLGVTAATTKPELVVTAVGITAAICFVLTIFAFQTKIDFTGCGVYLMVGTIIVMIFGFVLIFFGGARTAHIIYGGLGALVFSFYLIYDTQLMIGGKHSYSISPEEYIFAALSLYLDVIQIFIFILHILRSADD